jgi:hypothetical protein
MLNGVRSTGPRGERPALKRAIVDPTITLDAPRCVRLLQLNAPMDGNTDRSREAELLCRPCVGLPRPAPRRRSGYAAAIPKI